MNTVERIKSICKERKIPISRLESDLKFGNAYISGLKKGTVPDDRLKLIADYLNVSMNFLITGEDNRIETPVFEKEHIELITLYSQLEKEQKDAVFNLLRSFCSK